MTTVPQWLTDGNLGSYSQDTSFYLNPIILTFASAEASSVGLLNGSLPQGLYWVQTDTYQVSIFGESYILDDDQNYEFTLRAVSNLGLICDRTFFLTITALIPAPIWHYQTVFLGYQRQNTATKFTVQAYTSTKYPISYTLLSAPAGSAINSTTGEISIPAIDDWGLSVPVVVKSTVLQSSSSAALYYDLLAFTSQPGWLTPAGEILQIGPGEYVEYLFQAYTTNGPACTFTFSPPFPAGYTLSSGGLLQGVAPVTEQIQNFTVIATNVNGTTAGTYSILVTRTLNSTLAWTSTVFDFGSINDGSFYKWKISATSSYKNILHYSITGGWLPNSLTLVPELGLIHGFVDFHAIDHTYRWEISVTDGVSTIVGEFSLSVLASTGNQYAEILMPVTGTLKQNILDQTYNSYPETTYISDPVMSLISGLKYHNMKSILDPIQPWLQTAQLQLGNLQIQGNILYRNAFDIKNGADLYSDGPGGQTIPQTLQNIRQVLRDKIGFIGDGQEKLPQGQVQWLPRINLTQSTQESRTPIADQVRGRIWRLEHLIAQAQGLSWQGSTSYDDDMTTLDGGITTFQDWNQANWLVFDQNSTIFEGNLTTWDHQVSMQGNSFSWNNITITGSTTWNDVYTGVFGLADAWKTSDTLIQYPVNLHSLQLSNQNTVYAGNLIAQ